MYIEKLNLLNFRNYNEQEIILDKNINVFYGDNAQGKTNIIEAIYMCALGRSFRTIREKETIKLEKDKAIINIDFFKNNRNQKIRVELDNNGKNIFINDIKVKKISEILGNIIVVIFNPDDIEILKGNPEKRRKFLDIMIGQLKPKYIYNLSQYLKVLQQRNNYLKQIKYENKSSDLLEIWDEQLYNLSKEINYYRNLFIEKINNNINNIHNKITNNNEKIELKYSSNFNNNYKDNLKKFLKNDIEKGYTKLGIHRDDFRLFINNRPIDIFGSQGQYRSAILSLKLTELNIIKEEIGENPILLLDDFMSELDSKRKNNFLDNIYDIQVLITCTDKIEKENSKVFHIEKGKVN